MRKSSMPLTRTNEGGVQYAATGSRLLEFFSKAGSLRVTTRKGVKGSEPFYGNSSTALDLFQQAWTEDKKIAMKLLFWVRDCRGGAGNRSGFRECLAWLANAEPAWVRANLDRVPQYGRWDDLRPLFETVVALDAGELWGKALMDKNVLAAKWADRKDRTLLAYLRVHGMVHNERDFRKFLSTIRKDKIVEHKMCSNKWKTIDYEHVPSKAMAMYTNAFCRHDAYGFSQYKSDVEDGTKTIKAGVLFPHDCVLTARHGDRQVANLQFDALPDYIGEAGRIMVLCDTSGSMSMLVSGSIRAVDVSQALALYCSDRVGRNNPFYRQFLGFESESHFKNWSGMSFSDAVNSDEVFDGACGGTRIDAALDHILNSARRISAHQDEMPTMLLIISDMQFHGGSDGCGTTEVGACLDRWEQAGYKRPQVVYWNLSGYAGSPEVADSSDVALVSGFSPSILKAILGCKDMSPLNVMMMALEKYIINMPNNDNFQTQNCGSCHYCTDRRNVAARTLSEAMTRANKTVRKL